MKIELDNIGIKRKINVHIFPDEKMSEIGFQKFDSEFPDLDEYDSHWFFCETIKFPKWYKGFGVELYIRIPLDKKYLIIETLDTNHYLYYDYLSYLRNNPENKVAAIVEEQVKEWIKYLQRKGVISGNKYIEYVTANN